MTAANFVRPKPALFYEGRLDLAAMDLMAEQLRTRHLCITLNPGQRTLNLSEGDTTNVHKARLDSSDPPRSPAVRCAEWQNPASCGVLFCG